LVIRKVLQEKGLDEALRRLRVLNFFDDPELQEAAEQAEAARAKLEAVLRALATTS
jgi:hypothetical protein